jgi:hypothetical protein
MKKFREGVEGITVIDFEAILLQPLQESIRVLFEGSIAHV